MYFHFLKYILSRQSNQKHFKWTENTKQFRVVPSRLNIFPFQAHSRPLSNKVYYGISITYTTHTKLYSLHPTPLQHTEHCVIRHTPLRVKVDGGHALDPVDAGVAGHVAHKVERERGGLLTMLIRNYISVLGVAHRGQRVLVISDTTRVSLISQAERRTLSSYDINALTYCISPKPVTKYMHSPCAAHWANSRVTIWGQTEKKASESERTSWDHCNGSTPPTPTMCDLRNVLSAYAMPGMSSSAAPYEYSHKTTRGSASAREGLLMAAPGSAWTCPQQRHQVHVRCAWACARCSQRSRQGRHRRAVREQQQQGHLTTIG